VIQFIQVSMIQFLPPGRPWLVSSAAGAHGDRAERPGRGSRRPGGAARAQAPRSASFSLPVTRTTWGFAVARLEAQQEAPREGIRRG
jgi:hypothetical protein